VTNNVGRQKYEKWQSPSKIQKHGITHNNIGNFSSRKMHRSSKWNPRKEDSSTDSSSERTTTEGHLAGRLGPTPIIGRRRDTPIIL
jgi:hypothetical protein